LSQASPADSAQHFSAQSTIRTGVMLIVTAGTVQAEKLASDFSGLLPEARILVWEAMN